VKVSHHLIFFIIVIIAAVLLVLSADYLFTKILASFSFHRPKIDTIAHFVGFFCLAWLLYALLKIRLISILFTLSFYGALTELGQYFLGFRNGEYLDFYADVAGSLFFVLLTGLYLLCKKIIFGSNNVGEGYFTDSNFTDDVFNTEHNKPPHLHNKLNK